MPVLNLTPHVVTVVDDEAKVIGTWPGADDPARVEAERVPVGHLDDSTCPVPVPLIAERRTRANLPEPKPGVWLIVSSVVGFAHPERDDLLIPSDLVRDNSGVVTACRSFVVSGRRPRKPPVTATRAVSPKGAVSTKGPVSAKGPVSSKGQGVGRIDGTTKRT